MHLAGGGVVDLPDTPAWLLAASRKKNGRFAAPNDKRNAQRSNASEEIGPTQAQRFVVGSGFDREIITVGNQQLVAGAEHHKQGKP